MNREERYSHLPEALGEALLRARMLIGDDQLEYFYNLYDPRTGGFYYSISSRDAEGMTPFAEGTYFVISALRTGGMELPEWYKEKVADWIASHQDPLDGFFYEELWGKITAENPGARLYRDLNYSKNILDIAGRAPLYALPTERIKSGEVSSTLPDYLKSEERMLEYLDSLDWSAKAIWSTGQKLSTARSLIRAAGLEEPVRNYIASKQNQKTGLWGDGLGWMNTNGAMKLSCYFCNTGMTFPNPELAIESVKELYSGDTPPSSATMIWNPFVLLSRIIGYAGEREGELRELLLKEGADIVNRAIDCAMLLKRVDGGFAGGMTRGGHRQQGYLYGHGLKDESDLDGTLIAGERLYVSMHRVFGAAPSRDHYKAKEDSFFERLRTKPAVIKTLPRPDEEIYPTKK